MTQKNYGLIGCGMMGQEHSKNVALLNGAAITALFDPDAEQLALARALVPAATIYTSLDNLLADPTLDALIIASPNHTHVPILGRILQQGLPSRHVPILCEKPLFIPGQEEAIGAFATAYKAPLWVAMEYRYMPAIAALKAELQAITGGVKMLTIKEHRFPFLPKVGHWNRFNINSGGTLVEKCCHFFDLMRLLINSEPVRVFATAGQVTNHLDERYDGHTPDIWDAGYVVLDFENGARAALELCMFAEGSRWQEEISALGIDGKIDCRIPGPPRFWPSHLGEQPTAELEISPRQPVGPSLIPIPVPTEIAEAGDHHGGTYYQHQKFLEVVKGLAQPEVSILDGLKAVKMGIAAQQSAEQGRSIML